MVADLESKKNTAWRGFVACRGGYAGGERAQKIVCDVCDVGLAVFVVEAVQRDRTSGGLGDDG